MRADQKWLSYTSDAEKLGHIADLFQSLDEHQNDPKRRREVLLHAESIMDFDLLNNLCMFKCYEIRERTLIWQMLRKKSPGLTIEQFKKLLDFSCFNESESITNWDFCKDKLNKLNIDELIKLINLLSPLDDTQKKEIFDPIIEGIKSKRLEVNYEQFFQLIFLPCFNDQQREIFLESVKHLIPIWCRQNLEAKNELFSECFTNNQRAIIEQAIQADYDDTRSSLIKMYEDTYFSPAKSSLFGDAVLEL